jgi:DNA invertase Pin-like site-specific DNA recombinase
VQNQNDRRRARCFGYGRLSAAKPDLTEAVQEEQSKDYWQQQLEPAGIAWGGFFCDTSAQGSQLFADRKQGGEVFALAETGDHVVVWQLDRAFQSAADGAAVIRALAARGVRFHSLELPGDAADLLDGGIAVVMRAVGEIGRSFASERTLRVIAKRRERGLPIGGQAPVGWKIIGLRARETKSKKSTREYAIDDRERRLAEAIHAMRQAGTSIERIAVWLMTQREYPNKRRFDNYKAVEWAIAAKELGFPLQTDSKQIVREWRTQSRERAQSGPR